MRLDAIGDQKEYEMDCLLYGDRMIKELDGRCMWHVEGTEKLHTEFWWGESREGYHYEDVGYRVLVGRAQGRVPL